MTRRTYWHLEALGRRPTEYEIATSRLLYYPERGFEIEAPLAGWYRAHQEGSALVCADWERFADPRATTYGRYSELMRDKEVFVERLLACEAAAGVATDPGWLEQLDRIVGPVRYPVHGLQMVAAYVGSMAPSGRIVVACLFQAADELRRIEQLSHRMRQLEDLRPGFGRESRARWEDEAAWQPLRRVVEQLLVTFDWGEALVVLNGIVKPFFDRLFLVELAACARARRDDVLEKMLLSLDEDARWHREWFDALLQLVLAEESNGALVQRWLEVWVPRVDEAVGALEPLIDPGTSPGALRRRVREAWDRAWSASRLRLPHEPPRSSDEPPG